MTPACENCRSPLPERLWNTDAETFCESCAEPVIACVFPAAHLPVDAARAANVEEAAEASCFHHPESRAASICEGCGRFLCSLCELRVDGAVLCPSCLEHGVRKGKTKELESSRTMYDSVALHLAAWPSLLVWPVLFTAPAALFVAIRHWRAPSGLMRRSRWRYWAGAILASVEVLGIVVGMGAIVWSVMTRGGKS